jgi:2-polyprenyl-3-methyl-5-hydroxy-6-metoxy-1,4-benzoquinol methylase
MGRADMNDRISLNAFTSIDQSNATEVYIRALEDFNGIVQLQELKRSEKEAVPVSSTVLDVGCGFGLESLAFAGRAGGAVHGLDKSEQFIVEARRRASQAGFTINYKVGTADALPYPDRAFDHVRAERLLIYFADVAPALAEMRRVLRSDGTMAVIEPDFSTTTVNITDRALLRRVMAHEADTAVSQSWLPGRLPALLSELGFKDIAVSTRVLIFPQDLAAAYFSGAGQKAADDGAISAVEHENWKRELRDLHSSQSLFGSEGYFLFFCR